MHHSGCGMDRTRCTDTVYAPGRASRMMRIVSFTTRNLRAGLGIKPKLPVIRLAALLGLLLISSVPLVVNFIRVAGRRLDLAHGLHMPKQHPEIAILENPLVFKSSGLQSRISEHKKVESSSFGSTAADSGWEESAGDLVIVEEVGNPPAMREDTALQLAQASVGTSESCNLFEGQWVPDPKGPLYRHSTCRVISDNRKCQAHGRLDKGYEYWKWEPRNCSLPRFDPHAFLEVMRGKTLAFVGDSLARNHMESLICSLLQAEEGTSDDPMSMEKWYFPTHSVTIIRIWSSWLVHNTTEELDIAPGGPIPEVKLHLDKVDEKFDNLLPTFDVLIISGGHWFEKEAAFLVAGKLVGAQLMRMRTHPGRKFTVDRTAAFAIATRTALQRITSHPGYKGLTILRTYSPDHYFGGTWRSGGFCDGMEAPSNDGEYSAPGLTALLRQHQVDAYNQALQSGITNQSKLRLMDITPAFEHRPDGHPGPYNMNRSRDPKNKPHKRPYRNERQDCVHWCLPGPIDTWNVFLLEMLKQDLN